MGPKTDAMTSVNICVAVVTTVRIAVAMGWGSGVLLTGLDRVVNAVALFWSARAKVCASTTAFDAVVFDTAVFGDRIAEGCASALTARVMLADAEVPAVTGVTCVVLEFFSCCEAGGVVGGGCGVGSSAEGFASDSAGTFCSSCPGPRGSSSVVLVVSPPPEVRAPPELRTTTPVPGVATVSDDDDSESFLGVSPALAELFVVVSFEGVDVGTVAGGLAPVGVVSDDWFASLDVELAVADGSSAHAIAGGVANAPPMPSATARPPTRPMYLAYVVATAGREFVAPGLAAADAAMCCLSFQRTSSVFAICIEFPNS